VMGLPRAAAGATPREELSPARRRVCELDDSLEGSLLPPPPTPFSHGLL
jgi:hypothetical protein